LLILTDSPQLLQAREEVLNVMNKSISTPSAMRKTSLLVDVVPIKNSQRARIIGPGGIVMKKIERTTGAVISFPDEEVRKYSVYSHGKSI
jgi:polyribonucleotide nucleotidyltransferase